MKKLLLFSFLLMSLWSCQSASDGQSAGDVAEFASFYQQFHQDTVFQLSRITFPLDGKANNQKWQKENWKIHQPIDFTTSEFRQELQGLGPDIIQERIIHQNGDYALTRRFARIDGNWHLIFYSGMQTAVRQ